MTEIAEEPTSDERVAGLERRLAELEASSIARVVQAELKAHAVRAGMVDLDGLKLLDLAGVALDETGEVAGAAALMAQLRKNKPWLFGAASSSSAAAVPPAQPAEAQHATRMSHGEWQKARAELLRRR